MKTAARAALLMIAAIASYEARADISLAKIQYLDSQGKQISLVSRSGNEAIYGYRELVAVGVPAKISRATASGVTYTTTKLETPTESCSKFNQSNSTTVSYLCYHYLDGSLGRMKFSDVTLHPIPSGDGGGEGGVDSPDGGSGN